MKQRPMTTTIMALCLALAVLLFVPLQFFGLAALWLGPILIFSALWGLQDL